MLSISPNAQLVATPRLPTHGFKVARQQVHEGGLACTVRAYDGHAGSHVDAKVDVLQAKVVSARVLEVHVHGLYQRRRQLGGCREVELHRVVRPFLWLVDVGGGGTGVINRLVLVLLGRVFGSIGADLLLLRLAVFTTARLGCLHLLLKLLICLIGLPPPLLIHLIELRKVALVLVQLVVVQVDDVRGHSVQKVPVMANHHERLLPPLQVLFQPQHRTQIQMVCGLIQQQKRGLDIQRASEGDAHAPATTEGLRRPPLHVGVEAQAVQDLGSTAFGRGSGDLVLALIYFVQPFLSGLLVKLFILLVRVLQFLVQLCLLSSQLHEFHIRSHHSL
mmetsp:Transcript_18689/g.52521  ORF Transcript_18689/g.52521 Transcript_18689/m.52521 type:complete len:333 (-) Transcript_18689:848-1846(-)